MQRTIFSVLPDRLGFWRIECAAREALVVEDVRAAIIRAHYLARAEHHRLGVPTAVAVHCGSGDAVLSGYHG